MCTRKTLAPPVMNKKGPIVIIEDDLKDQEILTEVFNRLQLINRIVFFTDGNEAFTFINSAEIQPYLILSNINMPGINGFELQNKIIC